jgi:DNA-binding transcriptional LysR family regulator
MFDTGLLRTFVAVAETGGFTRAANALNSTQSTISAQIQRLESDAGRPLFLRSTRSVQLTSAGETLLSYARTILRLNEDARLRITGNGDGGRLRIGAGEDLTETWLPDVLHSFRKRHADVELELDINVGPNLFAKLETQELDLAIAGLCSHDAHGRKLWTEPLQWAFATDVELPDVLPLALFPEPCPYRDAALRALASCQRLWRVTCLSSSLSGVRAAATAGLAITPLPKHAFTAGLRPLGKKEGLPPLPPVEYFLQVRQTDTRDSLAAFVSVIQNKADSSRLAGPTRNRKNA